MVNALTDAEREALTDTYEGCRPRLGTARTKALRRLIEPIEQTTAHWPDRARSKVRGALLRRVHIEGQPFWAWDEQTWITFANDAGRSSDLGYRGLIVAFANLLGHRRLHHQVNVVLVAVAELVFGRDAVQAAITEVVDTLRSWNASKHTVTFQIPTALSDLLLVTGKARLDEITEPDIRALAEQCPKGGRRSGLFKVSRVLAHQGIIATPLHSNDPQRGPRPDTLSTVPPSWLAWAQRWRALSTHEPGTIRQMFSVILIAGRWAAEKHPEALEPQLWTRDIAAEYVADTLHAVHGQWAGHNRNTTKKGQCSASTACAGSSAT